MLSESAKRPWVRGEAQALIHSPALAFSTPQLYLACAQEVDV